MISAPAWGMGAVGRLAQVVSSRAVITANGRTLSVCARGQYLGISGQTRSQYAVLMVDRSLGFVSKSDVRLLNYQVASSPLAGATEAPPDPSEAAGGGSLGQRLVQAAQGYLGVRYVWGGNTASGIDCSGFVKAVFGSQGITLPRHSGDQAAVGDDVPKGDWPEWAPGDRMYFACHHAEIDHTGLYIGGGYFIHASVGHGRQVAIDRVDAPYYAQHLVCVRRSRELRGGAAGRLSRRSPFMPPSCLRPILRE